MLDKQHESDDAIFDILEAIKPHFPMIAGGFARATGGVDLPFILDTIRDQHVMGAAAEASEPALVASLPEPVPVSASGDGQAQGPCTMGAGCDEAGMCYAEAHGDPDKCCRVSANFAREDRYIVIKRSDLHGRAATDLARLMRSWAIRTRECVVVEVDWPEYENVWRMIKERVTGVKPASSRQEPVRQWCSGCKDVREVECYRPDCPTALRLGVDQASSRQEERLSKELGRVCNKAEFPAFQRVMGTASAPKDLPQLIAYACELEDCVIGAKNKADGWRFIASEMGYEPGAHKHPPLGEWLTKRIAMFRARAAIEPPHAKEQGS